jgi:DeoR/GlpR family transcriptional regulator of sugar metabolism
MTLFVEERRRVILNQLQQHGRVSVKELSDAMHVSAVTIRQDLRALEEEGLLERTYGGAVRRTTTTLPELSFHVRLGKRQRGKQAIAAAAAQYVEDGFTIGLDASTTVYSMVGALKRFQKLTVITNSFVIAQSFLDSPHIQVLVPGGRLRRDSISIVGRPEGLLDINLNIGFFGARGVSLNSGISDVDADEVQMKSAMVARCVSTVILVDGSKWGQVAAYTFAKPQQIARIITTDDAPLELVEQFREQGVAVDLVPGD